MTLFIDGEPLDVDKLNKLNSIVEDLSAKVVALTDKFDAKSQKVVSKVPIVYIGEPMPITLVKGQESTQQVPVNSTELNNADQLPRYFVSITGAGKANVSFTIKNITRTSFTVQAYSNIGGSAVIQWVGIAEKTIS